MRDVIVMLLATINGIILAICCLFITLRHFGFSSVLFCFL